MASGGVEERRIIILGKVGAGKSAIGNAILGTNDFISKQSFGSVTGECSYASKTRDKRTFLVYDTPGVKGLLNDHESSKKQLKRCLYVTSPGFHIIVFAISASQRLEESDMEMFEEFKALLGNKAFRYSVIVFTHATPDELEELIKDSPEMTGIISRCKGRYLCFGDSKKVGKELVDEFDKVVESIVRTNGTKPYYKHSLYKTAMRIVKQDAKDLQKRYEGLSDKKSVEMAIKNAFNGKSPRDDDLLELTGDCCNIL